MEDISLYVWLSAGFFLGFCITAGALLWFFRRRAQGTCASHEWEAGPDGRLRCARCGLVAGERD
jgi:energy-converting hydrogenase Eha subunit G